MFVLGSVWHRVCHGYPAPLSPSFKQRAQPLHDPEQLADCASFTALSSHPEQHGPSAPNPISDILSTTGRSMKTQVFYYVVLIKTEIF